MTRINFDCLEPLRVRQWVIEDIGIRDEFCVAVTEILFGFAGQTAIGCPTVAQLTLFPRWSRPIWTTAWEQRKLSSIAASFDYGLNAAATEYDGKNKYLRITDIDDATHDFLKSDLTTPLADLAMSADYLLEEGDLLFARTGASVGKTYLYRQYDGTVYFAGFLIRARIGESADPEFVYQATLTDAYKKYVAITSQRSGQPGVNAQEYADYQLMLPSRTEQQQIGMTLRSLDNLITLHQRKCQYRGLYGYLSWEQRKLGELLLFQNGFNGSSESFGSGIPLISVMDVLDDEFITHETIRGKARLNYEEASRYCVEYGDVLFQRSSENQEDAGTSNVYLDQHVPSAFGGFVIRGKKVDEYNPIFIKCLLGSSFIRKQITHRAQGAQHINVSQDTLADVVLLMPSMREQEAVGLVFLHLANLITLHQ